MRLGKKLIGLILAPIMAATASIATYAVLRPAQHVKAAAIGTHNHADMTAWDDAYSLPTSAGSYYLTEDVTISSTWDLPGIVNLCLNGHSITKTGSDGSVFYLYGTGDELNLFDCDKTEHYYYIDSNYLGVVVDTKEAAEAGNPERNGSFVGGYITGGRGYDIDSHYRGGCMAIDGGAKFNFYGGTIIGNCPSLSDTGQSSGVAFVKDGYVTMHDGASLIGNYSVRSGVFTFNAGSFTMDGGLIADNSANEQGGVMSTGVPTSITGGRIFRNLSLDKSIGGGAIVIAGAPGVMHIGGDVEITGNHTYGFGGGVNLLGFKNWWESENSKGSLSISGSPKIHGNFAKHGGGDDDEYVDDDLFIMKKLNDYYPEKKALILEEALEAGAKIGVGIEEGDGLIVADWVKQMDKAEPKDYFFSNRENSILKIDDNGDPILFNLDSAVAIVTKGDDIEYYTDIDKALASWDDGSTLKLNKDVTAQITVSEGTKTLDLNNHVLSYDNASVIIVSGGELHVEDSSLNKTTHYYQLSAAWKAYGDVQKGPATISDTPTDYSFEGGYITSNNTTVFPDGAGILVSGGHAVFSSGTVFGTTAGSGGIRVQPNGHLTLEGSASVIGNFQKRDWCSTGGIDVSGRLDMTGGRVIHNSALTSVGGLRFRGETENEGNYCRIVGGEITQNYCETDLGHGIFVDTSKGTAVQIGGSAKIHDNGKPDFPTRANNLHFDKADEKMKIVEPFKEDANVWASWRKVTPSAEYPVTMTSNWSEVMGEKDPYNYLHYDVAGNEVYLKDGQAVAAPISYKVSFDGNSATDTMDSADTTSREYKLPDNGFTAPEGKRFLAWKYGDKLYLPGDKVLLSGDATITAHWVNKPGEEAFGLSGVIYENNGEAPVEGAVVKLIKGNQVLDMVVTDSSGAYGFTCDPGIYNLVVEHHGLTKTSFVEASTATVKNLTFDAGKTESVLNVNSDLEVIVGGLDAEAEAIRASSGIAPDKDLTLSMNVEEKAAADATDSDKIIALATDKNLEFFEIKMEQTSEDVTSVLTETSTVMEIIIPYANAVKREVSVYSYHEGEVRTFKESDTKADGTFIVDKDNGFVRVYTNKFSLFSLGYAPYYTLSTTITLGSYTGNVTAILENLSTHEFTKLTDVALNKVTFEDLKKGSYMLSITWVDGASNTITMPVTIG